MPVTHQDLTPQAWIVARANFAGLDRDAALVRAVIEAAGWSVQFRHCRSLGWLERFRPAHGPAAVFFLERVFPAWHRMAPLRVLIPNQERFPHRHLARLRQVDHVLCKSRHAREIFSALHSSAQHLGFTSPDRRRPGITPDFHRVLHLAGRSTVKGTQAVLEVWRRHPEWPVLDLIQCRENAPRSVPPNVRLHAGHLGDDELRVLQNTCGLHLCPSRAEGWGHYIVEGMSCGAAVVTTDAPPMNELVDPRRGVLVPWERSQPRHLGTEYFVGADALEASLARWWRLDAWEKTRLGENARQWFEYNDREFRARLAAWLAAVSPQG
jgi:glycosyltransferase involved in cell wall biosynthesis